MSAAAVYVADGERTSRPCSRAARGIPDAQHGGAPSALLARELEREAGELGLIRLTFEFLKPIRSRP